MTNNKRKIYQAELHSSITIPENENETRDELQCEGRFKGLILPDTFNYCGSFLTHGEKITWEKIFMHDWTQDERKRICWPGRERLAILIGVKPWQVTVYLQRLKKKGLLKMKRRMDKSSLYMLKNPPKKYMERTKAKLLTLKNRKSRLKNKDFLDRISRENV